MFIKASVIILLASSSFTPLYAFDAKSDLDKKLDLAQTVFNYTNRVDLCPSYNAKETEEESNEKKRKNVVAKLLTEIGIKPLDLWIKGVTPEKLSNRVHFAIKFIPIVKEIDDTKKKNLLVSIKSLSEDSKEFLQETGADGVSNAEKIQLLANSFRKWSYSRNGVSGENISIYYSTPGIGTETISDHKNYQKIQDKAEKDKTENDKLAIKKGQILDLTFLVEYIFPTTADDKKTHILCNDDAGSTWLDSDSGIQKTFFLRESPEDLFKERGDAKGATVSFTKTNSYEEYNKNISNREEKFEIKATFGTPLWGEKDKTQSFFFIKYHYKDDDSLKYVDGKEPVLPEGATEKQITEFNNNKCDWDAGRDGCIPGYIDSNKQHTVNLGIITPVPFYLKSTFQASHLRDLDRSSYSYQLRYISNLFSSGYREKDKNKIVIGDLYSLSKGYWKNDKIKIKLLPELIIEGGRVNERKLNISDWDYGAKCFNWNTQLKEKTFTTDITEDTLIQNLDMQSCNEPYYYIGIGFNVAGEFRYKDVTLSSSYRTLKTFIDNGVLNNTELFKASLNWALDYKRKFSAGISFEKGDNVDTFKETNEVKFTLGATF